VAPHHWTDASEYTIVVGTVATTTNQSTRGIIKVRSGGSRLGTRIANESEVQFCSCDCDRLASSTLIFILPRGVLNTTIISFSR
jgi:hypothetical protein